MEIARTLALHSQETLTLITVQYFARSPLESMKTLNICSRQSWKKMIYLHPRETTTSQTAWKWMMTCLMNLTRTMITTQTHKTLTAGLRAAFLRIISSKTKKICRHTQNKLRLSKMKKYTQPSTLYISYSRVKIMKKTK